MLTQILIEEFIENLPNLDLRQSQNSRYMDQKVTPDVLCIIAEIIFEYCKNKDTFTTKDLRSFDFSNDLISSYFGKPEIDNAEAQNEYDKFFQQPLKMLAYSGVLHEEKQGNKYIYSIKENDVLEFISSRDRNAYVFIYFYLQRVLKDSQIYNEFHNFFIQQDKNSFEKLKNNYTDFIIKYTPINGKIETSRIFTKILNPLAFYGKKRGTIKGRLSENIISYSDLLYNRPNWRDENKSKNITRSEFIASFQDTPKNSRYNHEIQKAKLYVRKLHPYSEVHRLEKDIYETAHIHHIFLQSEYPELADIPENLIALTHSQHQKYAHPHNKTYIADPAYQCICLLAKLDTIEKDEFKNENRYNKDIFFKVLQTGLKLYFDNNTSYEKLKFDIMQSYLR